MWQRNVWAKIDLDAIKANVRAIGKRLNPRVKFCAVVKADGYGHGAVQVARAAIAQGADMLATAILPEALELRASGITQPVLVLGFTPVHQSHLVVLAGVTQSIYTKEAALALSSAAVDTGKKVKVHLKVDTGMGRIGTEAENAVDFAVFVANLPGIFLEGIFSHFADADNPDTSYTQEQLGKFEKILADIKKRGLDIPLRHIANSAAAIAMPQTHFDMVRPGIALYGLWPSQEMKKKLESYVNLKPALSLNAQISHLKEVQPGRSISYGRTYIAAQARKIATLPLGYADGFNRRLSGKMSVFLHGQAAPLVGRICMDQCMLDVTHIDGVKIGDTAVVFGAGAVGVGEVATLLDTIDHEVVCLIGKRVPRVYCEGMFSS